jgi:hypothetical protein
MALPRSFSTFPIHGYFIESKRWGDSKTPKLFAASTISFGGFIDRVRRHHDFERTLFAVDVEVVNLAFISTQPTSQLTPNRIYCFHFLFFSTTNTLFRPQDPQAQHILQHHALDGIIKIPHPSDLPSPPHLHLKTTLVKERKIPNLMMTLVPLSKNLTTPTTTPLSLMIVTTLILNVNNFLTLSIFTSVLILFHPS